MPDSPVSKSKIIVIDDEESILFLLKRLLEKHIKGCEVITTQSGQEGLKQVARHSPDCIVSDINMPHMDGFEICRKIKSDPRIKLSFRSFLSRAWINFHISRDKLM